MEIKTNSMINNETNDEYFIPIEPDHAIALTMNFPQFSENNFPHFYKKVNKQCTWFYLFLEYIKHGQSFHLEIK